MLIERFYYIVSSYPQSPQAEQSPKLFPTPTSWHTSKHLLKCTFSEIVKRNQANQKVSNDRGIKVQVKTVINSYYWLFVTIKDI